MESGNNFKNTSIKVNLLIFRLGFISSEFFWFYYKSETKLKLSFSKQILFISRSQKKQRFINKNKEKDAIVLINAVTLLFIFHSRSSR